jgi:hypothetical protein
MDSKLRDQLQKSIIIAQALLDAESALAEGAVKVEPEKVPVDQVAVNTSARNKVLASALGSDKAALFGTLSTEPTMDAKALATALDVYPSLADAMVAEAIKIRAEALALDLTPKAVELAEDLKP